MGKYQDWWDNLSPQMQEYLKKQPVWHDRDVAKFVSVALVVGFFFGYICR